ncbi:AAA family ATPase [Ancylobacter amanitiformis]|uniref:SpoVK/Ycf46/Vps4 family AAA+-type ATPase n=1 Tax=Ancylobacter amanitiformis TaxID=217069 RepID=A0ABU0LQS9_9HYPH|nr:AAA family ATPase [Ancylobacter amanitiformis]MDQ0510943.1 SpoVK/Ycf46/Vps4 family AAA+-type ATPase [Ancylobacter amanitiformis]
MSKFDPIMRTVKFDIQPRETEHLLGGCGDPTCPQCYPRDGRKPDGRVEGGAGGSSTFVSDDFRSIGAIFDEMSRRGYTALFSGSALQDDREYENAKKVVEKYLLTAEHSTQWDDVVGNETARTALLEAIEHPAKHADLYRHYGKKPLKGVLLFGPPGCGKTMFGKAAAAAVGRLYGANASLIKINGPEIQSPFVGVTEQTIRNIFKFARLYKRKHGHPLVIFIDEADSILPPRDATSASFHASNVAAFLAEMDGLEESGAFVMLATNRPSAIDPAILRDGRIDRRIRVERPTRDAAHAIIMKAMAGVPLADGSAEEMARHACDRFFSDENVLALAGRASVTKKGADADFRPFLLANVVSGAMLVGLVERAKGIAFRRDIAAGSISGISAADITVAVEEILADARGSDHRLAIAEFIASMPAPASTEAAHDIPKILQ